MKILIAIFFLCLTVMVKADYWTQKADFGGGTRESAIAFSINGIGYVGAGFDTLGNNVIYKNDFWQYDPVSNVWTQKANIGTNPTSKSIGFSIGNYGYVGLGTGLSANDIWRYNPANNTWIQYNTFPGMFRIYPSVFVCNNKAYIGLGGSPSTGGIYYNDFWEYDPSANNWVQKNNFPGTARYGAISFSVNNIGYIGNGENTSELFDFWKYDPLLDLWSSITPCPAMLYWRSAGFSIGNVGYACLGASALDSNVWMYNPISDSWTQKALFPASPRGEVALFTVNSKAYVATGVHQWMGFTYPLKDVWEYTPDSTTSIEDAADLETQSAVYPNPASNFISISCNLNKYKTAEYTLYNSLIQKVKSKNLFSSIETYSLNISDLPAGNYYWQIKAQGKIFSSGKLQIQTSQL